MSVNFYVHQHDVTNPGTRLMDVFVGPEPPNFEVGLELVFFTDVEDLYEFLQVHRVDQIWVFRHPECTRKFANDITSWIEAHLAKRRVTEREEVYG